MLRITTNESPRGLPDPAAEDSQRVSEMRSATMKRTGNRWNRVCIVLGAFLPLLVLGCSSTKQSERLSQYQRDRVGTYSRMFPPLYPQGRRGSEGDHHRRVVIDEERIDEVSDGQGHAK